MVHVRSISIKDIVYSQEACNVTCKKGRRSSNRYSCMNASCCAALARVAWLLSPVAYHTAVQALQLIDIRSLY